MSEMPATSPNEAADKYLAQNEQALRSDDAVVAAVVGGILTLAFIVLVAVMLVVNVWTLSSVD